MTLILKEVLVGSGANFLLQFFLQIIIIFFFAFLSGLFDWMVVIWMWFDRSLPPLHKSVIKVVNIV